MIQENIKIGKISYLNLVPFFKELDKTKLSKCTNYALGVPSKLNQMLRDGLLDLSPASSVCLNDPELELFAPVGVKANGQVKSVYLGVPVQSKITSENFYRALRNRLSIKGGPKKIWVSSESEASVELCRQLVRVAFEQSVELACTREQPKKTDWQLWIGDNALKKRSEFRTVIDLSQAWKHYSKSEFVFAAWICRKNWSDKSHDWIKANLITAARLADQQLTIDPEAYWDDGLLDHGVEKDTVVGYWPHIRYELDDSDLGHLGTFLSKV